MSGTPEISPSEMQLREILAEIEASVVSGSAPEVLERHTSTDYVFTSPTGRISDRSEILEGLRAGSVSFGSYAITDVDVRLYGAFAIVIGRAEGTGTNPGGEQFEGSHRFTSAWTNDGSEWKLVAWQATEVKA